MNALSAWLDEDERRSERQPVRLCVNVEYRGTGPILADMTDLTELGCRLKLVEHIPVGQCLTVTVGRRTRLRGWVAWSKGREHGFDFTHPLKHRVLTTLKRSYAET